MKTLYLGLLLTGLAALLGGCNDSSYLEGIGPAQPSGGSGPGSATKTGRITLYCTNYRMTTSCGALTVYVDSENKGKLTTQVSSAPSCGTNNSGALTLTLPVGSHSFSVRSATSCLSYNFSETIDHNTCSLQGLQ